MSRHIDADNALRMMRNSKKDCPLKDDKKGIWDVAHDCAISCVEAVPTADAVEVVRCKDCKYKDGCNQYVLHYGDECELAFCSYGERSENGT